MKSLGYHLLLATAILVISYVLFTLFPADLPHPEDLSPYLYAIAFFLLLFIWLRLPGKRKWFYLPILLLCLLAMLDEAGYGSEVFDVQPYYSTRHNVEIRDLHNAISLGSQLFLEWLADIGWQAGEFLKYLALNGLLMLTGFLFTWRLRTGSADSKQSERRSLLLRMAAYGFLALGLAAAGWLLALPADPKNAFVAGYSAIRLAMIAGILLASSTPLALLLRSESKTLLDKVASWLDTTMGRFAIGTAIIALLFGFAYQLYTPLLIFPDQRAQLDRATPLIMWLFGVAGLFMLTVLAWRGRFHNSVQNRLLAGVNWLKREPAYLHVLYSMALILIAQLIDQKFINLDDWIPPTKNIHLWGQWTEEVFEMVGAVLFFVAGLYFWPTPKSVQNQK